MIEKIASRFILKNRVGGGSFGEIYEGEHLITHDLVAIKVENNQNGVRQLKNEDKIYRALAGAPGVPNVYWYGVEGPYNVLVMDLLGKNLEELLRMCGGNFSLKTVLMIADQMLASVQYLHTLHLIHRDIKPDNFLIGTKKRQNEIFLIDYGLAKKYWDKKIDEHIPYRGEKELVGTSRYVSISTHLGIEQSRRDDLECIGYVLVYLFRGFLPWQGFQAQTVKEKYEMIADCKMTTSYSALCEGLPNEFVQYFTIIRALEFTETPPYNELRQMFRDLFIKLGFVFDYQYDWVPQNDKSKRTRSLSHYKVNAPLLCVDENTGKDEKKSILQVKLPPLKTNPSTQRTMTRYSNPKINMPKVMNLIISQTPTKKHLKENKEPLIATKKPTPNHCYINKL